MFTTILESPASNHAMKCWKNGARLSTIVVNQIMAQGALVAALHIVLRKGADGSSAVGVCTAITLLTKSRQAEAFSLYTSPSSTNNIRQHGTHSSLSHCYQWLQRYRVERHTLSHLHHLTVGMRQGCSACGSRPSRHSDCPSGTCIRMHHQRALQFLGCE